MSKYRVFLFFVTVFAMLSAVGSCHAALDYSFGFTGAVETFTTPYDGVYKIELWGASSVGASFGAYVCGEISLIKGELLYIYVGEKSNEIALGKIIFNGGGSIGRVEGHGAVPQNIAIYNGAGATDVRLLSGDCDDVQSLRSRLIVAAGSGGTTNNTNGGNAGGLIGYDGKDDKYSSYCMFGGKGGSQTGGGEASNFDSRAIGDYGISAGEPGSLGVGGRGGEGRFHHIYYYGGHGGGGGYYGGGGSSGGGYLSGGSAAGGGGASFISGHAGCIALVSEEDRKTKSIAKPTSIHPSGKYFVNTVMIDGAGYAWTDVRGERTPMPNPAGGEYALGLGHKDDGFARITLQRKTFDIPIIVKRDTDARIAY
jgi:hypothetical protein